MDFVREIGAPWKFRLGRFCAGHWGIMEVQIELSLCRTLGLHDCSVWVAIVRDIGAPWLFSLGEFCAGHGVP